MKYSKEELAEVHHSDLVELYVDLRELCAKREEELDALWVYVEREADGMMEAELARSQKIERLERELDALRHEEGPVNDD